MQIPDERQLKEKGLAVTQFHCGEGTVSMALGGERLEQS